LISMIFNIITIFPDFFSGPFDNSLIKKTKEKGIIEIHIYNLRDFTDDSHKTVDDYPYGGGAGMIMKPEPFFKAYDYLTGKDLIDADTPVVYFTPTGRRLNQQIVNEHASRSKFLLICGRYEGVDQRVIDALVTDEISIGDYVISGGELAAMIFIESLTRLLPGAIGSEDSYKQDSFFNGYLDYPHYTRPPEYRGMKVPDVLLSGNHSEIEKWRRKKALEITKKRRPDLIEKEDE
jgi:tRNA (guanine37-N1)-methyltransferase